MANNSSSIFFCLISVSFFVSVVTAFSNSTFVSSTSVISSNVISAPRVLPLSSCIGAQLVDKALTPDPGVESLSDTPILLTPSFIADIHGILVFESRISLLICFHLKDEALVPSRSLGFSSSFSAKALFAMMIWSLLSIIRTPSDKVLNAFLTLSGTTAFGSSTFNAFLRINI